MFLASTSLYDLKYINISNLKIDGSLTRNLAPLKVLNLILSNHKSSWFLVVSRRHLVGVYKNNNFTAFHTDTLINVKSSSKCMWPYFLSLLVVSFRSKMPYFFIIIFKDAFFILNSYYRFPEMKNKGIFYMPDRTYFRLLLWKQNEKTYAKLLI